MFTYNLIEIHLTRKMLGSQNNIDNADQPASQICGIRTGNIPMKVILVDCIHIIGLSIKRDLLLSAIT